MKGEYLEAKNETHNNMFSKLQHQHQHQHQHQQHHHHHHHHQLHPFVNPFQVTSRECQTSEEADDAATATAAATAHNPTAKPISSSSDQPNNPHPAGPGGGGGDGATIEVVRRPRGRPPGSKNKPKPPVIITRDPEPAMSPYILEVPGGNDVVEAIARFCRRKNMGLCVLTGSGTVANVTLRQPSTTHGATVTFHGRFDILSVTATFLPNSHSAAATLPNGAFTISLAGPQGQIVGGLVAGALVAAGTVYIVGASFNNPSYHRLPTAEDEVRNSGGAASGEGNSPPISAGGGDSGGHAPAESCGMSMYSCQLPSDVIWAPTARQPPHPPPY